MSRNVSCAPECQPVTETDYQGTTYEETAESTMLFCICCLSKEISYVHLSTCSHADFLNSFTKPEISPRDQVVCCNCHNVLKKIKMFTIQVISSFNLISKKSDIEISHHRKGNLKIIKQENINIPQININTDVNQTIDNKDVTNQTPQRSIELKSLQTYEKKMRNIGNALKIINSNQNNACINLLATSLNTLSNSLISQNMDLNNLPILNNIISNVSQNAEHISKVTNSKNIIQESMLVDNEEDNFGIKDVLTSDQIEKQLEVPSKNKKIETSNKNVLKYSIQSRIKTVTLSQEELMAERSKMAASQPYLKTPYKCQTCVLGFKYEENLQDHVKRKHCYKDNVIKCDICQQSLDPGPNYDDHIAYHYTRFECRICGLRHTSEHETICHYRRNHIKSTKYNCLYCSYNMTSYRHIKLGSPVKQCDKFKMYKCLRCKRTWRNEEQSFVKNLQAEGATVE